MRKLFEVGYDVCFRFFSDEIEVSDRHKRLNDNQLQTIAQMLWGDDIKTEVIRTTETVIAIVIDSSTGKRNSYDEEIERILIRKVAETE